MSNLKPTVANTIKPGDSVYWNGEIKICYYTEYKSISSNKLKVYLEGLEEPIEVNPNNELLVAKQNASSY